MTDLKYFSFLILDFFVNIFILELRDGGEWGLNSRNLFSVMYDNVNN